MRAHAREGLPWRGVCGIIRAKRAREGSFRAATPHNTGTAAMSTSKDIKNLAHAQEETPEELEALKLWWEAHGNLVTGVLVVLLLAVVGTRQWNRWRENRRVAAMEAFQNANTPEELEETIHAAKSAEVVPLARIRLGNERYARGEWELALASYEEFVRETPKHPLAPLARVGAAHSLEALGRLAEAEKAYADFAGENPESFLAAEAALGEARTLVLQGGEARARGKAMLDLFLTENAGKDWAAYADELLRAIDRLAVPEPAGAAVDAIDAIDATDTVAEESAEEATAVAEETAGKMPALPGEETAGETPAAATDAEEAPAAPEEAPAPEA